MSAVDELIQSSRSKNIEAINKAPQIDLPEQIQLDGKFTEKFDNLSHDIDHIDARMKHINDFVINLETQVNNLRALIANDDNPTKRGHYYTLMNTCVELNARYEELYLKCLDIKFKYRKEQDDLQYKVKKMVHLDIPRLKKDNIEDGDLSSSKLSSMLNTIMSKLDKTDTEANDMVKSLTEFENDNDYKIG